MKTIVLAVSLLFLFVIKDSLFAQLTVVNGSNLSMTPVQLVQDWLVGQNVTVSNVTYNGSSAVINNDQIGTFTAAGGAATQLGLDDGIIMTCGKASLAVGPNNSPGQGSNTNGPGDFDLTTLAGVNTFDKAVIEFDFFPLSDTLKFSYVFGSEEFYEFCYAYNDAFGFFLSGPGIAGTFSNNSINIARMPGSNNYVTINNLCADPSSNWNNTGGIYLQYDGLSYVYTAWHIVQPCQTYHIKLAIADAKDHVLDSGVFLEKNSFSSTGLQVYNTFSIPTLTQGAIEGCNDAIVSFKLLWPNPQPYTIHLTLGGTATNGVDFPFVADSVVVPANEDSTGLVIHPYMDGIPEGVETFTLLALMPGCLQFIYFYDTIKIFDNTTMTVNAGNDTAICNGNSLTLQASPSGGQVPYQYTWNTGSQLQSCTVTPPLGVNNFSVTVSDLCSTTASDGVSVTVKPVPQVTNAQVLDTACSGSPVNIPLQSSIPGSTFTWTATSNSPNITGYSGGSGNIIFQTLTNAGFTHDTVRYSVQASFNGCSGPAIIIRVVVFPSPDAWFLPSAPLICSGQTSGISIFSNYPGITFNWTFTAGSPNISGAANGSGSIINQALYNSGITAETIIYHVIPDDHGCQGNSYPVTVTVKPVPLITNSTSFFTLCSGSSTNIELTSTLAGTTFSWSVACNSVGVSGYSAGNGSIIIQQLQNSGSTVDTVTYTVTPLFNGCTGVPVSFRVAVCPVPDIYFIPPSQILCSTEKTGISLASHTPGATFSWTASGSSPNITGYSPGTGSRILQELTNAGYTPESVTYHATPFIQGCPGISNDILVTVKPASTVTLTSCNDPVTVSGAKPFRLKGGVPPGGVYSGPGVNPVTDTFDPALAGTGIKTIRYTFTNSFGCSLAASITINVTSGPAFTCGDSIRDVRDGRKYPTVTLGTRCWMASNLDYGNYIPASLMQRDNCMVEKYCYQENAGNCTYYGALYQWDEVMQYEVTLEGQGLCLPGWHIPSEAEWNDLFSFYINNGFAASPLKFDGYSGFNAMVAGTRFNNSTWNFLTFATMLWSSDAHGSHKAWAHGMNTYDPSVSYYPSSRTNALSVRCIKD